MGDLDIGTHVPLAVLERQVGEDRAVAVADLRLADHLGGRCDDPSQWFTQSYPRYRLKRLLRFAFDHFQSDMLFDLLLSTRAMRAAAGIIYFHHKGVFDDQNVAKHAVSVTEQRARIR